MKKECIRSCICGSISGVILYFVSLFYSDLMYISISSEVFEFLFYAIPLLGALIMVLTLIYKKPPIGFMLLRSIIALFSHFISTGINGSIGTVRFLHHLLNFNGNAAQNISSGGLFMMFVATLIIVSIITILVASTVKLVSVIVKSISKKKLNNAISIDQ